MVLNASEIEQPTSMLSILIGVYMSMELQTGLIPKGYYERKLLLNACVFCFRFQTYTFVYKSL